MGFDLANTVKPVDQLSPRDFSAHRVWEFVMDTESELPDEGFVKPFDEVPVSSLDNRLVSALLTLANGRRVLGMLGNLDLANPRSTEQFLTVSVFDSKGRCFHLARYHDSDYPRSGPLALAAFLGEPIHDVFPMCYDISDVTVGHPECIRRSIPAEPMTRLSQDELISLALR